MRMRPTALKRRDGGHHLQRAQILLEIADFLQRDALGVGLVEISAGKIFFRQADCLVVYGFDENKKPRAAKFAEPEFELARKAADLMKLTVFEGDATKLRRALKNVRAGNVYASGWAFVPSIPRRNQFDALVAKLTSIKSETTDAVVDTGLPVSWDSIAIGQTVLGQAELFCRWVVACQRCGHRR